MDTILKLFPLDENLFILSIYIATFFAIFSWTLSFVSGNVSIVDRLWPLLPMLYVWLFTLFPVFSLKERINLRLLISSLIITIWGFRLTYNYFRKGGYSLTAEDYRWTHVKKALAFSPFLFQVFNLTFIAFFQNFLLLAFTLPGYVMYINRNNTFNLYDSINTVLLPSFIIFEALADKQQWDFQEEKRNLKEKNRLHGDYIIGFIKSRLFKYSRHPNFFCEMMIWWTYYFYSVTSTRPYQIINFSIVGTILLTLLFQGSTLLTEAISKSKYPQYDKYQKSVNRFIPWFSKQVKYQ